MKPEDGDESSDYSSANESFLDEDPKSSNDPDVLGLVAQGTWEPGRTSLSNGTLLVELHKIHNWKSGTPKPEENRRPTGMSSQILFPIPTH